MKKLSLLLVFALTTLVACKKDKVETNTDLLIGKWTVNSVTFVTYRNNVEIERNEESKPGMFWDFRDNGTATVNFEGSDDLETNWIASENMLKFSVKENQLDFQINSLTKNNMLVIYNLVDVENGVTYRSSTEFRLTK